jgi:Tol biopolymer transport system component
VLAIGVTMAAWLAWNRGRTAAPERRQELVSTFPGSHSAPSFSPDGRMLAFLQEADGTPQVWIKNLAQGDPVQITHGPVAAARPRWSPANDRIVFAREGQGIWSVPPLGGEERLIVEPGYNPNFSSDGRRIVFERGREIWLAAADGTNATRVEGVPLRNFGAIATEPAISPDGTTLVYFLQDAGPTGDLWTIPSAGGQPRRLTSDGVEAGSPVWTPDGRSIAFWSQRSGSRVLWQVSRDGGTPEAITTGAGEDTEPDLAADGRLVFANVRNDWRLQLTSASGTRTLLERRAAVWLPTISPDSRSITFFQAVGSDIHVFVMDLAGGSPRQVTFTPGTWNIHPRWSPDGRHLYYYQERPPPGSFRRIPVNGGDSTEIASGWRWTTHNAAAIDPSGTRVVYHRQVPGQQEMTLVRDMASARETVVSEPGLQHLHNMTWSRDGQSIAGWRHNNDIVICPAGGGACKAVVKGGTPIWPGDQSRLYFFRPGSRTGVVDVWSAALEGKDERRMAEIGPLHPLNGRFDVFPNGDVLWSEFRQGRRELWMLDYK